MSLTRTSAKALFVSIAAVSAFVAVIASAQERIATLPPARFDHAYTGTTTVKQVPPREARATCTHLGAPADGCSYVVRGTGTCNIIIPNDLTAFERERFIRHEVGHCNGWSARHER